MLDAQLWAGSRQGTAPHSAAAPAGAVPLTRAPRHPQQQPFPPSQSAAAPAPGPGQRRVPHSPCAPPPRPARSSAGRFPAGPTTGWPWRRPRHLRGRRQPSYGERQPPACGPFRRAAGQADCTTARRGGTDGTTAAAGRGEQRSQRREQPGVPDGGGNAATRRGSYTMAGTREKTGDTTAAQSERAAVGSGPRRPDAAWIGGAYGRG